MDETEQILKDMSTAGAMEASVLPHECIMSYRRRKLQLIVEGAIDDHAFGHALAALHELKIYA